MTRKIAALLMAVMAISGVATATADATPPSQARARGDIACLKQGQAVLRELGLFSAAARGEIDYSTLADPVDGPIFAALPEGSFLPINQVFALHKSNPELFAWCR